MSEDLHKMDDLFRSGLEGKEEIPSPTVWENIESALDKKERRPAAGFFRRKAAAILIAALGSAALFAAGYFAGGGFQRSTQELPSGIPSTPRGIQSPSTDSSSKMINERPIQDAAISKPATSTSPAWNEDKDQGSDITGSSNSSAAVATRKISPREKNIHVLEETSTETNPSTGSAVSRSNSRKTGVKEKPIVSGSSSQAPESFKADIATGIDALPPMIHEPASVGNSIHRSALLTTSKISAPSIRSMKRSDAGQPASAIPVANKKAGSLKLPAFSITPVVALQSNSNKVMHDGSQWGYDMKEGIDGTEHTPSRISGGLLADLRISRNISLQSGLILSQRDVHIDPKSVRAVKDIDGKMRYRLDCSAGTYFLNPKQGNYPRPGDTAMTRFSSNSLNYLNIPLSVKWHLGNSKLQFFAIAGAGLNLLTNQKLDATLDNSYQYGGGRATNLKSNFFNGMIGAGLNYNVTEKVGINFSPQYQFALTPMNENMPVKAMPRSFNLQLGLQLKLK